nr:uncharacterized protein LOC104091250 [Nicotiana tomentosiformis]
MVNVDLLFQYRGDWIREPQVVYSRKLVYNWKQHDSNLLSFMDIIDEYASKLGYVGVQQLLVYFLYGKYYEVDGDVGIRTLQSFISDQFNLINLFAVEDSEMGVNVPNIVDHTESSTVDNQAVTYCSSNESEDDSCRPDYDSEDLETLALQKKKEICDRLADYKELYKGMSFKDIPEARKVINLYCLANCYGLTQLKSCTKRLRYRCEVGFPFVCHISKDKNGAGVSIRTLKAKHKCNPSFDNPRVDYNTIAQYFKTKIQDNPKIKVKEMKAALKTTFNINISHSKCKRAKRMILKSLDGSFVDEYNKLEAYVNELRISNPGSDVIINISKDALAEGNGRFSRMYICFHALKMGFKSGLRPFIGLDRTFLKGKVKGQLLVVVALDSMKHFYPIAWAIEKETKVTWNWFLTLLKHSLDLKLGDGFTFMSDMEKGLVEAMQDILPDAHHRYCVRQIKANWCKRWGAGELKKYLWWCSWSSYNEDFKDQLKNLGELNK